MRQRHLFSVIAAAATFLLAGLLVTWPANADTVNLVNGDFETGDLSGWDCDAGTAVSGQARSGGHALAGTPAGSGYAGCRQTVSVLADTDYTLTGHVRGSYIYIGVEGGASNWTPGTGAAYQALSVSFTTGANQTSVTVYIHGWYGQPTYHADDLVLSGPGGPDPTPTTTTGEPTPTDDPTDPPTDPPGDGPLPKHSLTGYWHNFVNGSTNLRLRDVPPAYDLIAVAFADAVPGTPGAVDFAVDPQLSDALGGYTEADVKADVAALQAQGRKVIISVGGEKGSVSVGNPAAAAAFAASVHDLMTTYGFDGVDIDLENGLNPDAMTTALRDLSSRVGSDLIITMAPQTIDMQSPGGSYFRLALNIKDILTVVHTQFYNSGSMLGCDNNQAYGQGTIDFIVALTCIQLENGLRPDQVAIGLPATRQAAGGGYVSPSVVNAALDCLATGENCGSFTPPRTYPSIRGAMTWSINWDRAGGLAFSGTVGPHLDTLP
ncbi:chitinase [Stackebrandtia albiflava]|uniref:chitinase n=1 Tax=Stackebrandtia albiflava TaxID=406432 RepID=A0A562UQS2_9ACTN|nr:glycosyl hydrolase family 18 protein [Stackebrandtia albiflava]TWJ07975.1 chitinase [Stackebrandtia albiflava]